MKLKDRYPDVPRKGVWYRYGEWSILDCGALMETAPYEYGGFTGWEAMRDRKIIRADSWEELQEKIKSNHE